MKIMFLYGMNANKSIWQYIQNDFKSHDVIYVEYPHSILQQAKNVEAITQWVYETYQNEQFDLIVGHSMGGIIATQLVMYYHVFAKAIVTLDTNFVPANAFYRNLMMPQHKELYGEMVMGMIQEEATYYTKELQHSLQAHFDYTEALLHLSIPVLAIYGDRGQPNYEKRYEDLCLNQQVIEKLQITFIENCCHMPMLENDRVLVKMIEQFYKHIR